MLISLDRIASNLRTFVSRGLPVAAYPRGRSARRACNSPIRLDETVRGMGNTPYLIEDRSHTFRDTLVAIASLLTRRPFHHIPLKENILISAVSQISFQPEPTEKTAKRLAILRLTLGPKSAIMLTSVPIGVEHFASEGYLFRVVFNGIDFVLNEIDPIIFDDCWAAHILLNPAGEVALLTGLQFKDGEKTVDQKSIYDSRKSTKDYDLAINFVDVIFALLERDIEQRKWRTR